MFISVRIDIEVEKLRRMARNLAQAQRLIDTGVQAELLKTAQEAERAARAGAQRLPRRGGLSRQVASSRFSTRRRPRAGGTTVSLVVDSSYDLRGIDRGVVVHPTFGHRPWVTQPVAPGWFSGPVEDASRDVDENINSLVAKTIRFI